MDSHSSENERRALEYTQNHGAEDSELPSSISPASQKPTQPEGEETQNSNQDKLEIKIPSPFPSLSSDSPSPQDLTQDPTQESTQTTIAPKKGEKKCTLCSTPRSVLVRCQIDETGKWHFVCPGKCWRSVSGGEIDAKGHEDEFPHYRYGGMWKNRTEDGPRNAKKPKSKRKKKTLKKQGEGEGGQGEGS